MTQVELSFDAPVRRAPSPERKLSIDERFADFHRANPHVYVELRRAALHAVATGATRLSIAKLAEDLRADPLLRTVSADFKINNDFRRPFAELLMKNESSLMGRFELRTRRKP
jgi:hypothetical protein